MNGPALVVITVLVLSLIGAAFMVLRTIVGIVRSEYPSLQIVDCVATDGQHVVNLSEVVAISYSEGYVRFTFAGEWQGIYVTYDAESVTAAWRKCRGRSSHAQ